MTLQDDEARPHVDAPVNVLHLGIGMSAALVSKLFADLGSNVHRVAPPGGDPFEETYPSLALWHADFQCDPGLHRSSLASLLAWADVCVIGGEAHPSVDNTYDADALAAKHPRLVVLEIAGDPEGAEEATPAVELLVQAKSGLVHEMFSDHPIAFALRPGVYGAAFIGHCGAWAALLERERSGRGQVVRTSLMHGLSLFFPEIWVSAEHPNTKFENVYPRDVQQLIFECSGGDYIQVVLGVPGAVARLYALLGIDADVDPTDPGRLDLTRGPRAFFADFDLIAPYVRNFTREELLPKLWEAGLGAEPVLAAGECWDDEQIAACGVLAEREGQRYVGPAITLLPISAEGTPGRGEPDDDVHPRGPLHGIRVVDFGNFIAGPMAGRILADLGADVIKVDPVPLVPPIGAWRTRMAGNRGKRRVALDVKSEAGYAAARRLCDTADAVMHNFRVGVAERLSIEPSTLRSSNGDLVSLETTAYGKVGPKIRNTGFDMVMQALVGMEQRAGGVGHPPLWARTPAVDYAAAWLGAATVIAGLYRRNLTGDGAEAQIDLARTSMLLMADVVVQADGSVKECRPLDRQRLGFHPAERLYRATDAWLAIAALDEQSASRLMDVFGLATNLAPRHAWGDGETESLSAAISIWDAEALAKELRIHGVWCAVCPEDGWAVLSTSPVAVDGQLVIELDDPVFGCVRTWSGALMRFSRSLSLTAPRATLSPPASSTREVLAELGYSPAEVDKLAGAVVGEVIT